MKRRSSEPKETKIEIIPMIDTMFFLLVFFLLSSLNIIKLESLGIKLPRENDKPEKKIDKVTEQLTVSIKADGFVYVNNVLTDAELVGEALIKEATRQEQKKQKKPGAALTEAAIKKMSVTISAEAGGKHGLVVACIDSARQKNIERFAIAVDRKMMDQPATVAPKPAPK